MRSALPCLGFTEGPSLAVLAREGQDDGATAEASCKPCRQGAQVDGAMGNDHRARLSRPLQECRFLPPRQSVRRCGPLVARRARLKAALQLHPLSHERKTHRRVGDLGGFEATDSTCTSPTGWDIFFLALSKGFSLAASSYVSTGRVATPHRRDGAFSGSCAEYPCTRRRTGCPDDLSPPLPEIDSEHEGLS